MALCCPVKRLPSIPVPSGIRAGSIIHLSESDIGKICAEACRSYFAVNKMQQETEAIARRELIKSFEAWKRERQKLIVREQLEDEKVLKSLEVFVMATKIMIGIVRPQKGVGMMKELFPEEFGGAYQFVCTFPDYMEIVVSVFKKSGEDIPVVFFPEYNGRDAKKFTAALEDAGIVLRVPERKYAEASRALFALVRSEAKCVVLPWHYGFNPVGEDAWIYAKAGDLTMKMLQDKMMRRNQNGKQNFYFKDAGNGLPAFKKMENSNDAPHCDID